MLSITDVTIEKIRNNDFEKQFPEFYELKNVVENGYGHVNDSVFDHTLRVLEKLKEVVKKADVKIISYLNQAVDKYSRKNLLFLATLFHDIAKKETLVEENGVTSCLGHEELGYKKMRTILKKFDLSDKEKDIVLRIIRYHGELHQIGASRDLKALDVLKIKLPDIYIELILLVIADLLGSQLESSDKEEYEIRMKFYEKIL